MTTTERLCGRSPKLDTSPPNARRLVPYKQKAKQVYAYHFTNAVKIKQLGASTYMEEEEEEGGPYCKIYHIENGRGERRRREMGSSRGDRVEGGLSLSSSYHLPIFCNWLPLVMDGGEREVCGRFKPLLFPLNPG